MPGKTVVLNLGGGSVLAVGACMLALERIYSDARAVASPTVDGGLDIWATPLDDEDQGERPERAPAIKASEAIKEKYRNRG